MTSRPLLLPLLWLSLPVTAARALPPDWPAMLPATPAPGGQLEAWFMGNTTLLFRAGDEAIIIDGFVSRPPKSDVLWRRPLRPNEPLIRGCLRHAGVRLEGSAGGATLRAILVAHGHYDHAMDAAVVARLTGAPIAGSSSTAQIAYGAAGSGGGSLPFLLLEPGKEHELGGGFFVRPFWFKHGWPNLFHGTATSPIGSDAPAREYVDTGSYGLLIRHADRRRGDFRVLVHTSAHHESVAYAGERADVVFLALGSPSLVLRSRVRRYWAEVAAAARPRLVVPIHWDDFFSGLDRGLRPGIGSRLAMRHLQAEAGVAGPPLRLMPLFQPVNLERAASGALDSELQPPSAPPPECATAAAAGPSATGP